MAKVAISIVILLVLLSCTAKSKMNNFGIIHLKTIFYDSTGTPSFTDVKKVWYKDSLTIEKVDRTNFVTIGSKTTVSSSLLLYRFINLPQKKNLRL